MLYPSAVTRSLLVTQPNVRPFPVLSLLLGMVTELMAGVSDSATCDPPD